MVDFVVHYAYFSCNVILTRLSISEYEFNNIQGVNVNAVCWKFNFWRHHELVESGRVSSLLVIGGSGRATENGPMDISDSDSPCSKR